MESSHGNTSTVLVFMLAFSLLKLGSGQWQVTGPDNSIKAFVGEDVVFSCSLSPKTNAEAMEVRFFRNRFSAIVHLYKEGKDQENVQMAEYQKRTELLKDGIVNGIVSLKLKEVTPSDAGLYRCSFDSRTHQEEATWKLEVSERPSQNSSWYAVVAALAALAALLVLGMIVQYCLWKKNLFPKCGKTRPGLSEQDPGTSHQPLYAPPESDTFKNTHQMFTRDTIPSTYRPAHSEVNYVW